MSMRLIDAESLKELFREVIGHIAQKPEMNGNLEHMIRASAMVIQMIDDAPTVQPERKTGHWILDRSGAYCCGNCMEPCASYAMMKPRDKFCKMCGAKMEGGES